MLRVLVKGNANLAREFRCNSCGCRFLAYRGEYYFGRFSETPQSRCPNCKRVCYGSYGIVSNPDEYEPQNKMIIRGYTY